MVDVRLDLMQDGYGGDDQRCYTIDVDTDGIEERLPFAGARKRLSRASADDFQEHYQDKYGGRLSFTYDRLFPIDTGRATHLICPGEWTADEIERDLQEYADSLV